MLYRKSVLYVIRFFSFFPYRHQAEKRIRMLPEIDGLSKDTVVTSWMAKYDALMKGQYLRTPIQYFIKAPSSHCVVELPHNTQNC